MTAALPEQQLYRCTCVVLAAGGSRRLGRPKQLLRLRGETLLHRSSRLAVEAGFAPVYVVLGSRADEMQPELDDLPVTVLLNEAWAAGMSTSLRLAMRQVEAARPVCTHLLVLVCDQVGMSAEILRQLTEASRADPERIAAAFYGGAAGVPAIFPAAVFPELAAIEGDRGARVLLQQRSELVLPLLFPQGLEDVDTAEDCERAGLE